MIDRRSGQSVIEMIIALAMLTFSFMGIAALLSQAFFLNRTATQQTIGSYLAAEGIELTKNIIDNDVYGNEEWGTCCRVGNYIVDYTDTSLQAAPSGGPGNSQPLKFDPQSETYQYETGNATDFQRIIKITVSNAQEIDVESIVTWDNTLPNPQTIILEDHFYDWHP